MRKIARLSELDLSLTKKGTTLNVCVVSSEILGPVKGGGIAVATAALVNNLIDSGHKVTVLYTLVRNGIPECPEKTWDFWVEHMLRRGIDLAHIPHAGAYNDWREKSWLVKDFIASGTFDLVYFNDYHGSGYYTMAAKRAGLLPFAGQIHCVITHGSMLWVFNTNDQFIVSTKSLEMIEFERRSVEWADIVVGPSLFLLREYERYGWKLPPRTHYQPLPWPYQPRKAEVIQRCPIDELVFFGRFETRKGLWLFCDALDRIKDRMKGRRVTFMGRMTRFGRIPSAVFIVDRAADWPFEVRLLTRMGQLEALEYLQEPGRLAIMPSLADNSPCVVYECIENQIPFIAGAGSGVDELVHPDCRDDILVEPTVDGLATRLLAILDDGAITGRAAFDFKENWETWTTWHRWISENFAQLAQSEIVNQGKIDSQKIIFVCIDNADLSLSLLLQNAVNHFERFGSNVEFLFISSRRTTVMELLEAILQTHAKHYGVSVTVMGPEDLAQARATILLADIAFFAGAQDDVLAAFLQHGLRILSQNLGAAVSCITAEKDRNAQESQIAEIPCGDIPALAALGHPMGSSVWAVSVLHVRRELEDLVLHYADCDELVSAKSLGDKMLQRVSVRGKTVCLLPIVGAFRIQEKEQACPQRLRYRNMKEAAQNLDLPTFVGLNVAPWFAMSLHGAPLATEATDVALPGLVVQRESHPLHNVAKGDSSVDNVAETAAALGRLDEAFQISMANPKLSETRVNWLKEIAVRALKDRPTLDLMERLINGVIWWPEISGNDPRPAAEFLNKQERRARLLRLRRPDGFQLTESVNLSPSASLSRSELIDSLLGQPGPEKHERIYLLNCKEQSSMAIFRDHIALCPHPPDGAPLRLIFLDIPLTGQRTITAQVSAPEGNKHGIVFRLSAFDQITGDEIAQQECYLRPRNTITLTVPLYGVYGFAGIIVETNTDSQQTSNGSSWGHWTCLTIQ